MADFLNEDFLLGTATAKRLYHDYAAAIPVIDYHCHLPPEQLAADHIFQNLTQAWLYGDHYKWRAMRTHGVSEKYCTGNAPDREKFHSWAATVPYTIRNPLYHWTHLELQRYFNIKEILGPPTADNIYDMCSEALRSSEYSARNLLRKMHVKLVCTTDDPADDLSSHQKLKQDNFEIPVLPAFRPDAAMMVDDADRFKAYVNKLESVANKSIQDWTDYVELLKSRHDFFAGMGCRVSDHGLSEIYAEDYTEPEIKKIFQSLRDGKDMPELERKKIKSALLHQFAEWDFEKGWVQQFHLGSLRNNSSRQLQNLGPDTGWDSIGDSVSAKPISKFLDRLDREQKLAKTILYNLNPADNEMMCTIASNFNDGTIPGKMQWGAAWWFLDQKDGMTKQLNTLSSMGLLSHFIGMLTDSRSFLSYPRHEYFRRLLCQLLGKEVEDGELPGDLEWIGTIIQDICYNNCRKYFNWQIPDLV
jgi:glucuronate isomerase